MVTNKYLTTGEAARYLGVSNIKIRNLINENRLTVSYDPLDDRKRLIKKNDLDALKIPQPVKRQNIQPRIKMGKLTNGKKNTSNINRRRASNGK